MSTADRAPTAMHDHALSGHGADALTLAFASAAGLAHALQAAVAPLLVACAVGSFCYSTLNFLANWPETRAKFRRNRAARRERRRARIMGRYPEG